MQVTGYLGAVLIGALVGLLGRLILPGRQRIGAVATFVIGVCAAVLGTFVARMLNIDHKAPVELWSLRWDWIILALQVGFAIVGVAIANMLTFTRLAGGDDNKRKRQGRSRAKNVERWSGRHHRRKSAAAGAGSCDHVPYVRSRGRASLASRNRPHGGPPDLMVAVCS